MPFSDCLSVTLYIKQFLPNVRKRESKNFKYTFYMVMECCVSFTLQYINHLLFEIYLQTLIHDYGIPQIMGGGLPYRLSYIILMVH